MQPWAFGYFVRTAVLLGRSGKLGSIFLDYTLDGSNGKTKSIRLGFVQTSSHVRCGGGAGLSYLGIRGSSVGHAKSGHLLA